MVGLNFIYMLYKNKNLKSYQEYYIWKNMKSRCYSKCNKNTRYQKVGITVCDRWKDSFINFIEDMGFRPSNKHSIDRIDNNKGYSPENCRWAIQSEQMQNVSVNKNFSYNGETFCLKEWSKVLGIKYTCLYSRIYKEGLSFEEAISKPNRYNKKYTVLGFTGTYYELCDHFKMKRGRFFDRINSGWSLEEALTIPKGGRRNKIKKI